MAKGLIFTDAHNKSFLKVDGPFSKTHGSSRFPNKAAEKLTDLVRYMNRESYSNLFSNGDITDLEHSFDTTVKGAFEMAAAMNQFDGETSYAIGNRDPFWALGELGINLDTHFVKAEDFVHTDFILAQPEIKVVSQGLAYRIIAEKTLALIEQSTASNLVLLQHWSALRKTEEELKEQSPSFHIPENEAVINALEERAQQGGSVHQFSGDAHDYIERESSAGVRYVISPSFSQSHADNQGEPCNIVIDLEEDSKGVLTYAFKQMSKATTNGKDTQLLEMTAEELMKYSRSHIFSYQERYIDIPVVTR